MLSSKFWRKYALQSLLMAILELRTNVVDLEDILQVEKAAFTVIFFTVVIC
jgi:hypothetical protein